MLEKFADEDDYLYETSSNKERDFLKKKKKVWTEQTNRDFEIDSDKKYDLALKKYNKKLKKMENEYNKKLVIKKAHEKPIEEIIIESRNIFFNTIEIIKQGRNPIKYFLLSEQNKFSSSILFIMIGVILLLFATLMKNP